MRILYGRDDGSEYLFLRRGALLGLDKVHEEAELLRFASRAEADSLLRRLAHDAPSLSALRSMLPAYSGSTRLTWHSALRRLAELLWRGDLLLHHRRFARAEHPLEINAGSTASAAAPPPPRSKVTEEIDTFPAGHDPAGQAKALKEAAQAGVPFCEECQKA